MPNGGSDCCGTCWFNAKNKNEPGYRHSGDPEPDYCTIRSFPITSHPFGTYCSNHPNHRPERDPIPIGPVFTGNTRKISKPSPDTEEIRRHLLDLLGEIAAHPNLEYPFGFYSDEIVVWQLGEFNEARAIEGLQRVASFDLQLSEPTFGRTHRNLIELAREALDKITQKQR